MSAEAIGLGHAVPTHAPTLMSPAGHGGGARVQRAVAMAGDVLLLGGVVFSFPLVILAVGIPIALLVQLVMWIARLVT